MDGGVDKSEPGDNGADVMEPPVATRKPTAAGGKKSKKDEAIAPGEQIVIQPIVLKTATIELEGVTPLITHNFGFKARQELLARQMKGVKPKKGDRDPFADFVQSFHIMPGAESKVPKTALKPGESWGYKPDTFGFPASAFKSAMVYAASFLDGIKKIHIKGAVHVAGDLLPLKYSKVVMREDIVKVGPWGSKVADLRWRPEFHDWSVKLQVRFNGAIITLDQIVNLLEHAGFACGIGEWRPSKDGAGSNGTWAVKRS